MANKFDDMVNSWIVTKFISNEGRQVPYSGTPAHRYDGNVDGFFNDITVLEADMGWECGCYSSWTREDDFEITALLQTKTRTVQFVYGTWREYPDFIQELAEYKNNETCPYEREDYESDY